MVPLLHEGAALAETTGVRQPRHEGTNTHTHVADLLTDSTTAAKDRQRQDT